MTSILLLNEDNRKEEGEWGKDNRGDSVCFRWRL